MAASTASDLPKNDDDVDAFVIADKLRFGRITKEVHMDDYHYKALQTLTKARFYAVDILCLERRRFPPARFGLEGADDPAAACAAILSPVLVSWAVFRLSPLPSAHLISSTFCMLSPFLSP